MIYRNTTQTALSFVIDGERYSVPPGGECNISPKHTHVVKGRGLPLVEGTAGGELAEPTVERAQKPRFPFGVASDSTEPAADDEEDEAPAVTEAVEKLKAQGAMTPKAKRR